MNHIFGGVDKKFLHNQDHKGILLCYMIYDLYLGLWSILSI